MENNQDLPVANQTVAPKNKFLPIFIILSFLVVIPLSFFAGIKFGEQWVYGEVLKAIGESDSSINTPLDDQDEEPETSDQLATETESTANWKTYTNKTNKYSIKYPSDWTINTDRAQMPDSDPLGSELIFSKEDYKITIMWPNAFGPSICLFDDQSKADAPVMASYCEGKFVEIKQDEGNITSRRLEAPKIVGEKTVWSIYRKDDYGNFVGVPPTTYEGPVKYSPEVIKEMDQIIGSMTFEF